MFIGNEPEDSDLLPVVPSRTRSLGVPHLIAPLNVLLLVYFRAYKFVSARIKLGCLAATNLNQAHSSARSIDCTRRKIHSPVTALAWKKVGGEIQTKAVRVSYKTLSVFSLLDLDNSH